MSDTSVNKTRLRAYLDKADLDSFTNDADFRSAILRPLSAMVDREGKRIANPDNPLVIPTHDSKVQLVWQLVEK